MTTMTKAKTTKLIETPETIRCLSIRQPYADDVFFGGKWAENRSWSTKYSGELWVHASSLDDHQIGENEVSPTGFMTGHILGSVVLQRCVDRLDLLSVAPKSVLKMLNEDNPKRKGDDVDFCRILLERIDEDTWRHVGQSKFVWIFSEPRMLDRPVKVGGKLGVWKHETTTERLLMATGRKKKWSAKE